MSPSSSLLSHPTDAGVDTLCDLQPCVGCDTCVCRISGGLCLLCKAILQDAGERRRIVERNVKSFCQAFLRVCIGQRNAEILGSLDIDARHRCRNFGKVIVKLPLAFFLGGGTEVAAGKAVPQQFHVVGQGDVRTAAVCRISLPQDLNDFILRRGCTVELGADPSLFGDATAADVAKGKTFTSTAGLNATGTNTNDADTSDATATAADIAAGKTAYVQGQKVTGTAEPAESDNNVEAYTVTDTSPSVSFKRTDGTIKIWGYGTMTSSSGWGGQSTSLIAFCGDKYYKSAIYGSPSSTSLSLSISDGKLSGLPSGLTAINAVVTRGI